jgi:hypothetical protein
MPLTEAPCVSAETLFCRAWHEMRACRLANAALYGTCFSIRKCFQCVHHPFGKSTWEDEEAVVVKRSTPFALGRGCDLR